MNLLHKNKLKIIRELLILTVVILITIPQVQYANAGREAFAIGGEYAIASMIYIIKSIVYLERVK